MKNKKICVSLLAAMSLFGMVSCGGETNYNAEFTWKGIKATATLTPTNGGEAIVLDATVARDTIAATCEEDGKITYTATVEYEGKTYHDSKETVLEAIGHDYGNWISSKDGTHYRTCSNNDQHIEYGDCEYETKITKQPSDVEIGHAYIGCKICGDVLADEDLPSLTDKNYTIKQENNYYTYTITINGNDFSFNIKNSILEAEDSQRQIITEKNSSQGTTLRLDKDKLIEYIVDASEDISAVMSMNLWSRGQIKNDMSILSAYDIYVNNELLKEGELTDILPFETFGKTWGESITAKVQNIHLNKGVNFIRIISKNTNILMLDNIELKYSGAGEISLSNMEEFQAVEAQTIEYVSTDGVETVGINGLTTNASYLGKFTKGSNIRLNTIDYVEFDFESNTDARVTLSLEMSLRALSENKPILELYKVFIKENGGEYQEILANNKDAINQSITSTKVYGEFHTVNVAYLNLKAGATYNLKLQSRANTHLENVMFISESQVDLDLLVK